MAVYDINGNQAAPLYDKDGVEAPKAYDVDGTQVYQNVVNMTVMSYNVQRFEGLNADTDLIGGIVSNYSPEIIGIQELGVSTTMPATGQTIFADYPTKYIGPAIYNRPGIVSKLPLTDTSATVYQVYADEERGYIKTYFTIAGKTVCWCNTHLEAYGSHAAQRAAEAAELLESVRDEEYFIVTGDFNVDNCRSTSDAEYINCIKPFIDIGCHSANCSDQWGFLPTWTGGTTPEGTWQNLDQIITSPNITINSVTVDQTKIAAAAQQQLSIDHLPIIAEITIH